MHPSLQSHGNQYEHKGYSHRKAETVHEQQERESRVLTAAKGQSTQNFYGTIASVDNFQNNNGTIAARITMVRFLQALSGCWGL